MIIKSRNPTSIADFTIIENRRGKFKNVKKKQIVCLSDKSTKKNHALQV
jgi:hypothetical protein